MFKKVFEEGSELRERLLSWGKQSVIRLKCLARPRESWADIGLHGRFNFEEALIDSRSRFYTRPLSPG